MLRVRVCVPVCVRAVCVCARACASPCRRAVLLDCSARPGRRDRRVAARAPASRSRALSPPRRSHAARRGETPLILPPERSPEGRARGRHAQLAGRGPLRPSGHTGSLGLKRAAQQQLPDAKRSPDAWAWGAATSGIAGGAGLRPSRECESPEDGRAGHNDAKRAAFACASRLWWRGANLCGVNGEGRSEARCRLRRAWLLPTCFAPLSRAF